MPQLDHKHAKVVLRFSSVCITQIIIFFTRRTFWRLRSHHVTFLAAVLRPHPGAYCIFPDRISRMGREGRGGRKESTIEYRIMERRGLKEVMGKLRWKGLGKEWE